jgi:hypothetical protein
MSNTQKLKQLSVLIDELGLRTANKVRKDLGINYYEVMQHEGITIDGVRYVTTK